MFPAPTPTPTPACWSAKVSGIQSRFCIFLWFPLCERVFIDDCFHFSPGRGLSLSRAAKAWERLQTRSLEKVGRGLFLSASLAKAEPHRTYGFSGTLVFSGALATAAPIFISLPKF